MDVRGCKALSQHQINKGGEGAVQSGAQDLPCSPAHGWRWPGHGLVTAATATPELVALCFPGQVSLEKAHFLLLM